jgi:hypothetical protein
VVFHVVNHGGCVGVADSSEEFSRAPEGSPGVPVAEGGNPLEDLVGGGSFEEVEGGRDAHGCRQFGNYVDVVRHHTEFDHGDVVSGCDVTQHLFDQVLHLLPSHHVVAVFRAPFQMVYILAYAMATANKFHTRCPGQVSQSARGSGRARPVRGNEF